NQMRTIAAGDLSQKSIEVIQADEIGHLGIATNEMSENIRDMFHQVTYVSETVSIHRGVLTQVAGDVMTGSEQIVSKMEELASGSETQANSTSDLSSIMGTFTTKVAESNESGKQVQQNANHILHMTDEGREFMQASTDQMMKINQIV